VRQKDIWNLIVSLVGLGVILLWKKPKTMADNPDSERATTDGSDNPAIEQHQRETLKWARRATIGTWAYTAFTIPIAVAGICAAIFAQQSVQLIRKNFLTDQRPYLWLTNDFGSPEYRRASADRPTGQIIWEWHFYNFGKTPANRVHHRTFIKFFDGQFRASYGADKANPNATAPIPPSGILRHTAVSAPEVTPAEYGKMVTTDGSITLSGVIDYIDLSGEKYVSTFCLTRLATGAIRFADPAENCHNEIK